MSRAPHQLCLSSDHQVLTEDGRWVPLESPMTRIVCYDHDTEALHPTAVSRCERRKENAPIYMYEVQSLDLSFRVALDQSLYVKAKHDTDFADKKIRNVLGAAIYYKKGAPEYVVEDAYQQTATTSKETFALDRLFMFLLPRVVSRNKTLLAFTYQTDAERDRLNEILENMPDCHILLRCMDKTTAFLFQPDALFAGRSFHMMAKYPYMQREVLLMDMFAGLTTVSVDAMIADDAQALLVLTGFTADLCALAPVHEHDGRPRVGLRLSHSEPYDCLHQPTQNVENIAYSADGEALLTLTVADGRFPLLRRNGRLCIL